MYSELPIKVQIIPYRIVRDGVEVLLLKRSPKDGGFWNTVAGTLEMNESLIECRDRELREETGIRNVSNWTEELHRFTFTKDNYEVVVLAYAAQILNDENVILNDEHTDSKWVQVKEAVKTVEKQNVKECLNKFLDYLNS